MVSFGTSVGHEICLSIDRFAAIHYLETLRLMPSVPANMRLSTQSSVWVAADGTRYYIPKGIT